MHYNADIKLLKKLRDCIFYNLHAPLPTVAI